MGTGALDDDKPRYRAFISYSHSDTRFASRLHRRLEHLSLPGESPGASARLSPIFIDRAEFAAGADLSQQVRDALAASAALVVIASPAAKASTWVAREIELFRKLHPSRPVLTALIAGEPEEAFPLPLFKAGKSKLEPLAADFRKAGDGPRIALLKLAAGLSGLPLDRLVQRDAQARQRRVMAVTAASLLLSLILAALLVFALRARAEAERQRGEAEGLVEFMLTDLRDKLKGVGRLDVMDAVNSRANRYYAEQRDLSALPPDSLDRRARVLEAIGEDEETRGQADAAFAKYLELHRTTESLLRRDPRNPQRIFAHARSENRLALIETSRGNLQDARVRFITAKHLIDRLPNHQDEVQVGDLRSLVVGNLCAITLKSGGEPASALAYCREAIGIAGRQAERPGGEKARYALAFHYLWLGDAAEAAGDQKLAQSARASGLEISERLVSSDPRNSLWLEQHAEILLHGARAAARRGETGRARNLLARATANLDRLIRHDPANDYWAGLKDQSEKLDKEMDNDAHR